MSDVWSLRGSLVRRFETASGQPYYAGYVSIDRDHPWYDRSVDDLGDVRVHRGVTFSGRLPNLPAYPGWWVGFDFKTEATHRDPDAMDPSLLAENIGRLKALRDVAEAEGWPLCARRATRMGQTMRGNPTGHFRALESTLAARGARDPATLAAWIGRKKYGQAGFQKMAAKGRGW